MKSLDSDKKAAKPVEEAPKAEEKVDFSKSRNLILASITFIVGLSGITIPLGSVELSGMGLATIVAMIISILFMIFDKLGIMNEK